VCVASQCNSGYTTVQAVPVPVSMRYIKVRRKGDDVVRSVNRLIVIMNYDQSLKCSLSLTMAYSTVVSYGTVWSVPFRRVDLI
jgi:hypothetical protein